MLKGITLLAAHQMGGAIRQRMVSAAFMLGAALVAGLALIYALNALHDWLSPQFSPMLANLIMAGGLLVLAAILALFGAAKRNTRPQTSAAASATLLAAPLAVRGLERLNIRTIAAIGVLAAGALAGRHLAKGG